jgi:uncharacterized protein (DUF169 family)
MEDKMQDLKEMADVYQRLLKLKLYPVGVKFAKNIDELKAGKVSNEKLSFCQMVRIASQSKWTLACPINQMGCVIAQLNFGFRKKDASDVEVYLQRLTDKREIAESIILVKPKLKFGEIQGILVGPVENFVPDLIFLIIDSAQALVIMRAFGVATGSDLTFRTGASSNVCAYGAIISYLTMLPNLTIPCAGAKRHGLYQDYELIFVTPLKTAKSIADTMLQMEKINTINFPIIQGYLSPTKPVDYLLPK